MSKNRLSFIDKAKVQLKAGAGGNGCLSFHRAKYLPKGGPDGGNGGNGGSIILLACENERSLLQYKYSPHLRGIDGEKGHGKHMHGRGGDDKVYRVPVGTQVFNAEVETDEEEILLCDLDKHGKTYLAAKGGIGGFGNDHYKTSVDQTPICTQPGTPGEERTLLLQLKVLADVGIVGLPNAGKSSFLRSISNAKPEVANYPFTTLTPQLGTVLHNEKTLTFADIPGLIEFASLGKGLGHDFLSHIERCQVLLHLIDINNEDVAGSYRIIRKELAEYSTALIDKPEIIALSKIDTKPEEEVEEIRSAVSASLGKQVLLLSSTAGKGVKQTLQECFSTFYRLFTSSKHKD